MRCILGQITSFSCCLFPPRSIQHVGTMADCQINLMISSSGVAPAHEHGFFIIIAGNSGKAKHCLLPGEGVLKRCLRFG